MLDEKQITIKSILLTKKIILQIVRKCLANFIVAQKIISYHIFHSFF